MKKKYYYDCPIKALYMNKEFGVKFYTAFKNVESDFLDKKLSFHVDIRDIYNVLIELLGAYNASSSDNKIYVAPELEHIFEPKEGDIGIVENEESSFDGEEVLADNKFLVGLCWYRFNGGEFPKEEYKNVKIKLRGYDKKNQFFFPKEEN
tara:strand:+ start:978 stop:1427 length:450 start_codon:yes stop_codon:yes gene_type:complete